MRKYTKVVASVVTVFCVLAAYISFSPAPKAHASLSLVTRSGTQLKQGGSTFRFAGANIFPLGSDLSDFQVHDSLDSAKEMGATVVRTFGATGVGCPNSIEPALGVFNEAALRRLDLAIKEAGDRGIRLVLPLVEGYTKFYGGPETYDGWRGKATDSFFTDATVINDFEQRISTLLNRTNTLTGAVYKNDPTILAWETGNELHLSTGAFPPTSWTQTIADYIKKPVNQGGLAASQLLLDGEWNGTGVNSASLSLTNVDMYDDHFYPLSVSLLTSDASAVYTAGKVFYAGEYAWSERDTSGHSGGDTLSSFLTAIETGAANTTSGDTFWSLLPHADSNGYLEDPDGFTLHYPGVNSPYPGTPDMRSRAQTLRTHAYAMSGLTVPANGTPQTPVITDVTGNQIRWRGAALADTYTVERSTAGSGGPWTVICNQCATDSNTPWTDTTAPGGTVWYRVKGHNVSGVAGLYSPAYQANVTSLELLSNPGFESGLTSWSAFGGGTLTLVSSGAHSGTNASVVTSRIGTWMGPSQNITSIISSQEQGGYNLSCWAKLSTGSDPVVISVQLKDGSGTHYASSSSVTTGTGWTQITGNVGLNWIGTLTSAIYYVQTTSSLADLYVDDCSLQRSGGGGSTVVNDNDPGITYSGSWSYSPNRGAGDYLDDVHVIGANNDYFQYTFTGTGIDYIAEINSDRGNVDIYIDGVFQQTVNCNSNATYAAQQTVYSKTGLLQGTHTIKVVKTSGTYMTLDKLVVSSQAVSLPLNDTAAGVLYSGSWSYSPNRGAGDYQDDVHVTAVNGDSFQYAFFGTGIDYIAETNTDRGNVDIYIDGVYQQTISCFSSSYAAQQTVFSMRWLTIGEHTLKAVKTSGTYMTLDELVIYS